MTNICLLNKFAWYMLDFGILCFSVIILGFCFIFSFHVFLVCYVIYDFVFLIVNIMPAGIRFFNWGKEQWEVCGELPQVVSSYCELCICTKGILEFEYLKASDNGIHGWCLCKWCKDHSETWDQPAWTFNIGTLCLQALL